MTQAQSSIESDRKARKDGTTEVDLWLKKIERAREDRREWRDQAADAVAAYESSPKKRQSLNLWHSNVETIVPALYNSTPVPSAKRRFGDKDRVSRLAAEMIERSISFLLDQFAFDDHMLDCVRDEWLAGRGVTRIRYNAMTSPGENGGPLKIDRQELFTEPVAWDRWGYGPARVWEHVDWIWFDHDLTRDEVEAMITPDEPEIEPYEEPPMPSTENVADPAVVESILAKHEERAQEALEEYAQRVEQARLDRIKALEDVQKRLNDLSFAAVGKSASKKRKDVDNDGAKGILETIPVCEVWCKKSKRVFFITERDKKEPLKVVPDPLELSQFFPIPRPLNTVRKASVMAPVVAYDTAKDLYEEADTITRRIRKLVHQLRVRGLIDGSLSDDMDVLAKLDDGQYHSSKSVKTLQAGANGGLDKQIFHQPMEPTVIALKQLYEQREAIKQLIYEVTGISDILRGATDPHETLGAQKIKSSWGSQRVQRQQGDVARFARDLFRMMAEIICSKFDWEYLKEMTSMPFAPEPVDPATLQVPQPGVEAIGANGGPPLDDAGAGMQVDPQVQAMQQQAAMEQALAAAEQQAVEDAAELERQVEALIRSATMVFKIDIESDSTIRADLQRDQEQMNNFLNGTAQFWSAAIPAVQVVPKLLPHFTELYGLFAGKFRLGKQSEDILERMVAAATEAAAQPLPGNEGPTEQEMAAQQADADAKAKIAEAKIEAEQVKAGAAKVKAQAEIHKANSAVAQREIEASMAPLLSGNGVNGGTH